MTIKVCASCGVEKIIEEFTKDKNTNDGKCSWCKSCKYIYDAQYRIKNKDNLLAKRKLNRTQLSDGNLLSRNKHYNRVCARNSIRAHKTKGHECEITIYGVSQLYEETTHCPICGIEFTKTFGNGLLQTSPSLDRINNEQRLTYENVWIICSNCNATKRDRTMKEFVKYCNDISSKFKELI